MAITSKIANGIISGPPLSRISQRFCLPGGGMMPALARLSLILEESMITCRKNKFIRNLGFIEVKISFQPLTNVLGRFVLFNEKPILDFLLFHHHGLNLLHCFIHTIT